ncbi:MAG: hypothetical protein LH479_07995 [Polaromonas sp.]|nr:hypothetical protein [Polaromonas sp.]
MGPPPFRFVPRNGAVVSGPAFSLTFKLLATLIVLGCAVGFVQLWLAQRAAGNAPGGGWFLAGLLLLAYTWGCILRSTTRLDASALQQSWIWDKRMELADLAYCRLIRVRGLDWLIAPRLYARTLMGKFSVFYTASPEMTVEFERLVVELKAFRRMR